MLDSRRGGLQEESGENGFVIDVAGRGDDGLHLARAEDEQVVVAAERARP
jgi:hypothetical protein